MSGEAHAAPAASYVLDCFDRPHEVIVERRPSIDYPGKVRISARPVDGRPIARRLAGRVLFEEQLLGLRETDVVTATSPALAASILFDMRSARGL
jgi:hypothetical protein